MRGGALGDFILTLPIIRALRKRCGEVSVLANRQLAELASDALFALDDPDLAPFFVANAELPQRWRDFFSRHELVVSYLHDRATTFEQNLRTCGVRNFQAGPHRIEPGTHATEQLARPLFELGIPIIDFAPEIQLSHAERAAAYTPFAIHPGSGSARKNWPIENWIALIDHLLTSGKRVLIVGGEADEKQVARLRRSFGERLEYAIDWPLRKLASLLAGTTFIGHDSGISHLAAATGAPCLILFGPTDPKVWAPRNENARALLAPGQDLARLTFSRVRDSIAL